MRIRKVICCLIGMCLLLGISSSVVNAAILFEYDFDKENEDWVRQGTWSTETFNWVWDYPYFSDDTAREGPQSVRFFKDIGDSDDCNDQKPCSELLRRSMLMLLRHPDSEGKEFWYGFSIFIPEDWKFDTPENSTLVWQTKSEGDDGQTPQTAIYLSNDEYILSNNAGGGRIQMGKVRRGQWQDFVLHYKYSTGSDGFVVAYLDEERVGSLERKNQRQERLKQMSFGIYKWGWGARDYRERSRANGITTRELYFDSVRVGDHQSSFSEVSPQSNPVSPAPGDYCQRTERERANVDNDPDNLINIIDYSLLVSVFGTQVTNQTKNIDINCSGKIDIIDYSILVKYFDSQV